MERKQTVCIIKSIVKAGHVPSRGSQSYLHSGYFVNCFEHALLNLTNGQLSLIDAGPETKGIFGSLSTGEWLDNDDLVSVIDRNLFELAKEIGLKASSADKTVLKLNKNQWQIALYIGYGGYWHFALQESDGTWSAKEGWSPGVSKFANLTEDYLNSPTPFAPKLEKTYIITNPYAESE